MRTNLCFEVELSWCVMVIGKLLQKSDSGVMPWYEEWFFYFDQFGEGASRSDKMQFQRGFMD